MNSPTLTNNQHQITNNDGLSISTDASRIDVEYIHDYLSNQSYWAKGVPLDVVRRSIENSMCFGMYDGLRQIGLARVITDRATYAYLCDVFIDEAYRGRGLGKWLMATVLEHPDLQGLRRITLRTRDAHGLYRQFGFIEALHPENAMDIHNPDVYLKR